MCNFIKYLKKIFSCCYLKQKQKQKIDDQDQDINYVNLQDMYIANFNEDPNIIIHDYV